MHNAISIWKQSGYECDKLTPENQFTHIQLHWESLEGRSRILLRLLSYLNTILSFLTTILTYWPMVGWICCVTSFKTSWKWRVMIRLMVKPYKDEVGMVIEVAGGVQNVWFSRDSIKVSSSKWWIFTLSAVWPSALICAIIALFLFKSVEWTKMFGLKFWSEWTASFEGIAVLGGQRGVQRYAIR
jgi:hypothetical protein